MDGGKKNAADFEVIMLAYETVLICSCVLAVLIANIQQSVLTLNYYNAMIWSNTDAGY